jgi:hypothetical protein
MDKQRSTSRVIRFALGGLMALTGTGTGLAQGPNRDDIPDTPGTGSYAATKEVDSGLPGHVVYRPGDLSSLGRTRMGVYVFGNGGCSDDGASARLHLLEIASHGYLAIAPGAIYNGPGKIERPTSGPPPGPADPPATLAGQLSEAIDWAIAENGREGSRYFGRIDTDAIAVSGFSCGGVQALAISGDPRIRTEVIMNSGLFVDGPTEMAGMSFGKDLLDDLHFPTLYILGGPTDVAYANGMDDYEKIQHVPVAVASIDRGHGGTYWDANGGAAAQVVVDWLEWQLRGKTEAGRTFLGADCGLCSDSAWTYHVKGFE